MSEEIKGNVSEDTKEKQGMMMSLEGASGKYANFIRVSHTTSDFILDFCFNDGSSIINVSRVIVNAINIKAFSKVIETNISRFEARFEIVLPENSKSFNENGIKKLESNE